MSDNPYIVYCINCKDIFKEEGKPVNHILDIFGISDINGKKLNLEERRANKVSTKEILTKRCLGRSYEWKTWKTVLTILKLTQRQKKSLKTKNITWRFM